MKKYLENIKEIESVFYNDPKIPAKDLIKIKILSEEYSSMLWNENISSQNRHFMKLKNEEWPAVIVGNKKNYLFNWLKDWNENNVENFKNILRQIDISKKEILYFFWMKELCIETIWEIFYSYWINFLYEDEGCIIIFKNNNKALIFSNGNSWLGKR